LPPPPPPAGSSLKRGVPAIDMAIWRAAHVR
jgi:hypothetical protein